jgi:hypothetical protein
VRGARLVHELSGSLAAIALHLHMASKDDLPARSAEHIRDSLEAVRSARGRLTELAEILETLAKTG